MLSAVVQAKLAVPFRRYGHNVGHRPGMAAGRYPGKAADAILTILESAEANAQFKGLGGDLIIRHIGAQVGPTIPRGGRRRKEGKHTHVEVVLQSAPKEQKAGRRARAKAKAEAKPA
jgi:large subunit ribosomal protein L22